jgi:hypothetical protein
MRHLVSQRSAVSGQSESKQARAQEQEARRSYRQKSIRYEVMVTHSAPANFNARPNLLKFSVRARWAGSMRQLGLRPEHTFECMSQENPRAHQTHNRHECLEHRKIPLCPGPTKRWGDCTVKKIPCWDSKSASTEDLLQQFRRRSWMRMRTCPV